MKDENLIVVSRSYPRRNPRFNFFGHSRWKQRQRSVTRRVSGETPLATGERINYSPTIIPETRERGLDRFSETRSSL